MNPPTHPAPDAGTAADPTTWLARESRLLLAGIAMLFVTGFGIHWWLGRALGRIDPDDTAGLLIARLGVGLAIGIGMIIVGVLGWVLERRHQRLLATLQAARERLRQQEQRDLEQRRITLLNALAAGLAHELGQPLSVARVDIEGLHYLRQIGRDPGPEHQERILSRVGLSLVAMTQTIDHLRALAAPPAAAVNRPVDLVACVTTVLQEREQWLPALDVPIAWDPPAAPVPGLGDPSGIRLILVNLLRNAVEAVAGQDGGRRSVRITVGPGPVLAVQDQGPGIPPERLGTLFDPFQSTKDGAGRGIGLSLARASAQRMDATLEVVSHPDHGTIFTLRLAAD